jgi:5'-hydroxyaverantin dehydrogenase
MAAPEGRRRGPLQPEPPSAKVDFKEKYDVSTLKNKVALVTGGATGIGQGIAIALAEAGAYVTIADINVADAEETVKTITEAGHKAQFVHTDVCSWDALVAAFKAAVEFAPGEGEEKTLDIVIPAAGISHPGIRSWLQETKVNEAGDPEPVPLKVLDINLDAVFNTAHLAMYYFKKFPGKGTSDKHIIFVASMGGYTSMNGVMDYCTSKWAVRGLFRSLRGARWILGEEGPPLRCNLIAPTFVKTNMTKAFWGHMEKAGMKLAEVSDCTDVLLRFAADEKVKGMF